MIESNRSIISARNSVIINKSPFREPLYSYCDKIREMRATVLPADKCDGDSDYSEDSDGI